MKYSMSEVVAVADEAYKIVEEYLLGMKETVSVINVEMDSFFQKKDIDLLWIYKTKNKCVMKTIEIKGDRYSKSGNFFLETISNDTKNTPGCFMYTEADYIFYLFIDSRELNLMPVEEARNWFIENKDRFREVKTATSIKGEKVYHTIGSLVNKELMRKEVSGLKHKTI